MLEDTPVHWDKVNTYVRTYPKYSHKALGPVPSQLPVPINGRRLLGRYTCVKIMLRSPPITSYIGIKKNHFVIRSTVMVPRFPTYHVLE